MLASAPTVSVQMLLFPRATRVARCASSIALRRGCWFQVARRVLTSTKELKTPPSQHFEASAQASSHEEGPVNSRESDSSGDDDKYEHKHIVLYEAGSKRLLRISSVAAIMNGIFWSFYVGVLESHLPSTTWEPWGYVGLGCTVLMFGVSHTFAKHWVRNVSYFPDYRLLSIATHTFFGSERIPRLVKLGGTVVPPVRPNAIYVPFKVKGDFFYSLLDTDDGVFHNRDLLINLLKATPGGDAAAYASAAAGSPAPSTGKTKPLWKRRKRNR